MAKVVKICPNCGINILGNPPACPRCETDLSYEEADLHSTEELSLVEKPSSPDFENAYTAPVIPELIGATSPSPPESYDALGLIPPAPYTPPPLRDLTTSTSAYSFPSNYYLEQRVALYRQNHYEMLNYSPYQVTLAHGKSLSFFWWLIAMLSGIGLFWYFLILLTSGFSKDRVYLIVERNGTLYEDGAGAAHVRRQRALVGRRWGFVGVIIFFTALLWFVGMMLIGTWGSNRYRVELEAAYPTISLFSDSLESSVVVSDEEITRIENLVLAYSVMFALSLVALFGGVALTIVGYLHSAAYDVRVPSLPIYK